MSAVGLQIEVNCNEKSQPLEVEYDIVMLATGPIFMNLAASFWFISYIFGLSAAGCIFGNARTPAIVFGSISIVAGFFYIPMMPEAVKIGGLMLALFIESGSIIGACSAAVSIFFMRAASRDSNLHCVQCGYNLFGNVSGRCPECGVSINSGGQEHLVHPKITLSPAQLLVGLILAILFTPFSILWFVKVGDSVSSFGVLVLFAAVVILFVSWCINSRPEVRPPTPSPR